MANCGRNAGDAGVKVYHHLTDRQHALLMARVARLCDTWYTKEEEELNPKTLRSKKGVAIYCHECGKRVRGDGTGEIWTCAHKAVITPQAWVYD